MLVAVTTVLGMIPLLGDPFFSAMAVTIMFGLAFACVLTMIVVPVLFVIAFRIKSEPDAASSNSPKPTASPKPSASSDASKPQSMPATA
jgi:predicted RND superfamily exporter protein